MGYIYVYIYIYIHKGSVMGDIYIRCVGRICLYVNICIYIGGLMEYILYVQEVVTQPKILNRTILSNLVHVT